MKVNSTLLHLIIVCMAAMFCAGCIRPAKPVQENVSNKERRGLDSHTLQHNTTPQAPLNGEYDVIFHSSSFGSLRARMTAQMLTLERTNSQGGVLPGTFKANTRPNFAWSLVGGMAGSFGPVLAPFIFPSGMLLTWESTMPSVDPVTGNITPGEGWIGVSRIGSLGAKTVMKDKDAPIEVVFRDGRTIAAITLLPADTVAADSKSFNRVDYVSLTRAAIKETTNRLYSPRVARGEAMTSFCDSMLEVSARVQDDLEYAFAGALAWREHPELPLALTYRAPDAYSREVLARTTKPVALRSLTFDEKTNIATIEVLAFDDAADFSSVMSQALDKQPAGVILDLRSCTGYDLSALHAVSWFLSAPAAGGVFVPGHARDEYLKQTTEPKPVIPNIILQSIEDVTVLHQRVNAGETLDITIAPSARVYTGNLAVLTLSRTRGTAEVAANLLSKRANTRFFGDATANRPRLSFERPLEQGYVIRIPEYDWCPPDGKLGSARIKPDVKVSKEQAPIAAANWLVYKAQY